MRLRSSGTLEAYPTIVRPQRAVPIMDSVKIDLLAFASAGDILGTGETTLELPSRTTLAQLKQLLEERHPQLGALWTRLAIAVNGDLVSEDTALADGDEVALLPPVSGGSGAADRERGEAAPPVLTEQPLDAEEVARRVADPSCGAVVLFWERCATRTAAVRSSASPTRPIAPWPRRACARSRPVSRAGSPARASRSSTASAISPWARRAS